MSLAFSAWLRRFAAFAGCVFSTAFFPLVGVALSFLFGRVHLWRPFENLLVSLFFIFPQVAFPYFGIFSIGSYTHTEHSYFTGVAALLLGILQWSLIGLPFAWVARHLRFRYFIPLCFMLIIALTFGIGVVLEFFHIPFHLDTP